MVTKYFEDGKSGMNWYDSTFAGLTRLFGVEDAVLVGNLLAVTSANSTVKANCTLALKAYNQVKNGQEVEGFLSLVKQNISRILSKRRPSGPKVGAFADALLGDEDAVVVDRWMMRAYGFPNITPKRIKTIVEDVKIRASEAGVTPRQYQAAVWFGIKAEQEKNANDSRPFEVILAEMMEGDVNNA